MLILATEDMSFLYRAGSTPHSVTQSPCAVAQNIRLPVRPFWVFRMRAIGWNAPEQIEKNRRGMVVGRHGCAEGHVAQILEGIRKRIICGIIRLTQLVPVGKL